ncbi:hypothetical protein B0A50_06663 [Salinomyces thailandicus]|uniref:Anaphase-promoting complex subunit 4 n=1 Tax=Salinomyces thailandicus TaxID=706561 RepID=A0A4U0TRH4_9PEZI|nr:hypothetical protein B0A50_06663 [Salinomyces thailandica]
MNAANVSLPVISEKHFPPGTVPVNITDLVAYCDPHDLIAIASETHDVVVYRITGHPAFTVKRRNGDAEVIALKWKWDGSVLAIGWNDGNFSLHSGENGRLLSQGSVRGTGNGRAWKLDLTPDFGYDDEEEEGGPVVVRFSWVKHCSASHTTLPPNEALRDASASGDFTDQTTTEDWQDGDLPQGRSSGFQSNLKSRQERSTIPALVRSISRLDPTSILPKLSAIPAHGLRAGPDGSRFATQAAVDAVFGDTSLQGDDGVDVLLVCGSDGKVAVLQDDEVEIGSVSAGNGGALACAADKQAPVHAILSKGDEEATLVASFVEIPLDTLSSPLLHAVALNTKRIHNLLAYTTQIIRCIQHDLATGIAFPTRLLNNANLELAEKQEGNVVSNLFHLAMTTDFSDTMKEWLVDIVKETNHKRWDQAVNAMYTNIQNHLFMNLLPALDRLSIATTSLRGHAKSHEGSGRFDAPPQLFSNVLDDVDALRLVAKKAQLIIMTEHRQFRAFSKWLRLMIDVGVAGPGTSGAAETEEREVPNLDFPLLLSYIKSTLSHSELIAYVNQLNGLRGEVQSQAELFTGPEMSAIGYDKTTAALKGVDAALTETQPGEDARLAANPALNLPAITVHLTAHVRACMDRIAQWQSRMLSNPVPTKVEGLDARTHIVDVKAVPGNPIQGLPSSIELLEVPEGAGHIVVHAVLHEPSSGLKKEQKKWPASDVVRLHLSPSEIVDAKFYGNSECLCLARDPEGKYSILEAKGRRTLHGFVSDDGFVPEQLVTGGRRGKEVCLVLGNGGRQWRMLDLAAKSGTGSGALEPTTEDYEMSGME